MGVDHIGEAGMKQEIQRLWRELRRVARATMQNSAIGRAGLRIYDGGWLRIENGGLQITGTAIVSGSLEGSGTFDWTGPMNLRGSQSVTGPTTFTGQLTVNGAWDLNGDGDIAGNVGVTGDITVSGGGQIRAGAVTITPSNGGRVQAGTVAMDGGGTYGGRVFSTGPTLMLDASGSVVIESDYLIAKNINASGDLRVIGDQEVSGAKNFRMPHPTKPEHWLRHGSTESPVSGTEYTGRVTLDSDGEAVVQLPDYFEALNKARNRTVQLTPIGKPFLVGTEDVVDGRVTIYGEPGRDVFWLVKAERYGGDFLIEESIPAEPFSED